MASPSCEGLVLTGGPVSRILSIRRSERNGHSSGPRVAARL